MNRADHCQQVVFSHAFQEVSGGAGPHGSLNLAIAVRGCQHDDASSRELASNGDKNVSAVRAGKLQIHQGYVRLKAAKFSHGLHPVSGKSYQPHIGLRCDNGGQTLPENRVVFDAQDSYWRGAAQVNYPLESILRELRVCPYIRVQAGYCGICGGGNFRWVRPYHTRRGSGITSFVLACGGVVVECKGRHWYGRSTQRHADIELKCNAVIRLDAPGDF